MKRRSISKNLFNMLDGGGVYHEIVTIVKSDPYLDLEMRGEDGIMIYYRGGKILTVHEYQGLTGLDENYYIKGEKNSP